MFVYIRLLVHGRYTESVVAHVDRGYTLVTMASATPKLSPGVSDAIAVEISPVEDVISASLLLCGGCICKRYQLDMRARRAERGHNL